MRDSAIFITDAGFARRLDSRSSLRSVWNSPEADIPAIIAYKGEAVTLPPRLRRLPYLIHTNRELGLMLKGSKPLATFVDGAGNFPDVMLRYFRMFDRHVEAGRFVRHDYFSEHKEIGRLHYIYFALAGEAWRIEAMNDLISQPGEWSTDRERRQGELLGYTPEQNEIWMGQYQTSSP